MNRTETLPLGDLDRLAVLAVSPRRRGAVMTETVLILPIIMFLLAVMVFFGWGMLRVQRASVMDRYEAWRQVYHGYGPAVVSDDPDTAVDEQTLQVNDTFFDGRADAIAYAGVNRDDRYLQERLRGYAAGQDRAAGVLAARFTERWPSGRRVTFTTTHVPEVPLWTIFGDDIRHGHTRIGHEWKYVNRVSLDSHGDWVYTGPRVTPGSIVPQTFFPGFDASLSGARGGLAQTIRRYYHLKHPGYVGPDVDKQFPNRTTGGN